MLTIQSLLTVLDLEKDQDTTFLQDLINLSIGILIEKNLDKSLEYQVLHQQPLFRGMFHIK